MRWVILRVALKPVALEVLHTQRLVIWSWLCKLLCKGIAKLCKAPILLPVVEESASESVTRGREPQYTLLLRVWQGVCEEYCFRGQWGGGRLNNSGGLNRSGRLSSRHRSRSSWYRRGNLLERGERRRVTIRPLKTSIETVSNKWQQVARYEATYLYSRT